MLYLDYNLSILEYMAAIQLHTDVNSIRPCEIAQAELNLLKTQESLAKLSGTAHEVMLSRRFEFRVKEMLHREVVQTQHLHLFERGALTELQTSLAEHFVEGGDADDAGGAESDQIRS